MAKLLAQTASRKATHASTFLADGEDHGIAENWPTLATHLMERADLEEIWKNEPHRTLMEMFSLSVEWLSHLVGMSGPGAGLRSIDTPMEEIESIFDSVFAPIPGEATHELDPSLVSDLVQLYGSDEDILDAYYVFIHPYHPILPPPERLPVYNRPLSQWPECRPSSPLSLAISALLVLIPHPNESDPLRAEYVKLRRGFAQSFARDALNAVELDSSLLNPSNNVLNADRALFHPKVPLHVEGILALNLLSVYEYAQRGNLCTMNDRANEALTSAMKLSLHESLEEDEYAEARRRTWWMTGWKVPVEAQQTLLETVAFITHLEQMKATGQSDSGIRERMLGLDSQIGSLLFLCRDTRSAPKIVPTRMESPEVAASQIMIAIAEIRLHTLCAFQDIPSFHQRQYEFGPSPTVSESETQPESPSASGAETTQPSTPSSSSPLHFIFSSHESSKICFHGALNIVTLLNNLPFPNPTNEIPLNSPPYLSQTTRVEIPRSILTFACCGMQSGYVMLMLCLKARALRDRRMEASNFANTPSLTALLNELHQNLRLLVKCLNNCAIAFEALSGMRGTSILRLPLISLAELTELSSDRPNSSRDGARTPEVASSFGLLFTRFTVAH
ncbi:transcription factor domain-containing protein [Aspergillus fischeri NRRL 181]|uniref:Transcription factor domain-containing protein n=1 Tax=Neosartorya fischeri (strain ATCC 1020 / DSM 3700 / CBS 544.65 / FGSC A1164 / JCM 1740 / NRRL 181 / WB 181) TaxID=331117 RepID=A1DCE2_NEOFI|nr:conserved hypothetical protein [Aspergillus fischeri NRRL 181]EAW19502.1 conserved hypothetical protein [Aspergillus fischeri NRRL 181]